MKVFATPPNLPAPEYDLRHYNPDRIARKEAAHVAALTEWLVTEEGCKPGLTGKIAQFQVADGYAQYMFADKGRESFLIHLPYGDGYQFRYIERLTREDILVQIDAQERRDAFFAARS